MNEQNDVKEDYFKSEKTLELLREIGTRPSLTQRYLSEKYGISLGKTNFLLRAFLKKGLIKIRRFKNSQNKAGYAYILTPEGIKTRFSLTQRFLAIKLREYEVLKQEVDAMGEVQNQDAHQN